MPEDRFSNRMERQNRKNRIADEPDDAFDTFEDQETEAGGGRRGPWLRVLLFLLLLVILGGLALLALTGADPTKLREIGIVALLQDARASLGEEAPRQQLLMEIPADAPYPLLSAQGELALLCTTGELRALDEDGVERWLRPVQLQTPFICVEGRDVLYADLSGRTYGIVRDGASFFEKQSQHPLYNAYLSRDFIFLLQHSEDAGYSAVLEGVSREGGAVFTSFLTDYTPFSVRQAPQTGQDAIVLSGLSAQLTAAGGAVEFMAPDTTRLGGISSESDLFPVILQLNNGFTALVGESVMRVVDRDLLSVASYGTEGNTITAAALLDGAKPVLALLDAKRYETTRQEKTWLRVFDAAGAMKREFPQDGHVTRMVTAPGLIAAMTARQVCFYDGEGNELLTFNAREAVADVVLTQKGNAYVLADGALHLVRVKPRKRLFG